jgi:hypothetical protein
LHEHRWTRGSTEGPTNWTIRSLSKSVLCPMTEAFTLKSVALCLPAPSSALR